MHLKTTKVLQDLGFTTSYAEGRRIMAQGAVKVNGMKVAVEDIFLKDGDIISVGKHMSYTVPTSQEVLGWIIDGNREELYRFMKVLEVPNQSSALLVNIMLGMME